MKNFFCEFFLEKDSLKVEIRSSRVCYSIHLWTKHNITKVIILSHILSYSTEYICLPNQDWFQFSTPLVFVHLIDWKNSRRFFNFVSKIQKNYQLLLLKYKYFISHSRSVTFSSSLIVCQAIQMYQVNLFVGNFTLEDRFAFISERVYLTLTREKRLTFFLAYLDFL